MCIASLKVGPATTSDQQAIAGKCHRLVIEHECHTAMGMTRRSPNIEGPTTERDLVAMGNTHVRTFGPASCRNNNPAARALFQQPCARHVIGMDMSFECISKI